MEHRLDRYKWGEAYYRPVSGMVNHICRTCGTEYGDSEEPPTSCRICTDDRQYVGWNGQQWTTLDEMRTEGFKNVVTPVRTGLYQIVTKPSFGIGQRALLVKTDSGNLLWDCVTFLDDDTVSRIDELGGVGCIAISHPHFYSTIVEWSEAFGGVPVYIHNLDRRWVERESRNIVYWKRRSLTVWPGVRTINLGGHFPGSSVLHLQGGPSFEGGVLLSGDTVYVVKDRRWVSFMHSFPNYLPLPVHKVREIALRVKPYGFEDLFSGFEGGEIIGGADVAVQKSAQRYIHHLKQ